MRWKIRNKILKIANMEKLEKGFVVYCSESYLRITTGGHHTPFILDPVRLAFSKLYPVQDKCSLNILTR